MIGHAHLGQLDDEGVPKIVEAQAVQARLAIPSVAKAFAEYRPTQVTALSEGFDIRAAR